MFFRSCRSSVQLLVEEATNFEKQTAVDNAFCRFQQGANEPPTIEIHVSVRKSAAPRTSQCRSRTRRARNLFSVAVESMLSVSTTLSSTRNVSKCLFLPSGLFSSQVSNVLTSFPFHPACPSFLTPPAPALLLLQQDMQVAVSLSSAFVPASVERCFVRVYALATLIDKSSVRPHTCPCGRLAHRRAFHGREKKTSGHVLSPSSSPGAEVAVARSSGARKARFTQTPLPARPFRPLAGGAAPGLYSAPTCTSSRIRTFSVG